MWDPGVKSRRHPAPTHGSRDTFWPLRIDAHCHLTERPFTPSGNLQATFPEGQGPGPGLRTRVGEGVPEVGEPQRDRTQRWRVRRERRPGPQPPGAWARAPQGQEGTQPWGLGQGPQGQGALNPGAGPGDPKGKGALNPGGWAQGTPKGKGHSTPGGWARGPQGQGALSRGWARGPQGARALNPRGAGPGHPKGRAGSHLPPPPQPLSAL